MRRAKHGVPYIFLVPGTVKLLYHWISHQCPLWRADSRQKEFGYTKYKMSTDEKDRIIASVLIEYSAVMKLFVVDRYLA